MSDLFDEYPMLIFALESLASAVPAGLYRRVDGVGQEEKQRASRNCKRA